MHLVGLIIRILTNLLTPWSRVLLEKLTGLQPVKQFPAFYGTRRFITALTSVRHLSLSWTSPIQSIPQHPPSWRDILIWSSHLRLGLTSGLFPSGFHSIPCITSSPLQYVPYAPPISLLLIYCAFVGLNNKEASHVSRPILTCANIHGVKSHADCTVICMLRHSVSGTCFATQYLLRGVG